MTYLISNFKNIFIQWVTYYLCCRIPYNWPKINQKIKATLINDLLIEMCHLAQSGQVTGNKITDSTKQSKFFIANIDKTLRNCAHWNTIDWTCKLASKLASKLALACITRCREAERSQSLNSWVYINVKTIVPEICLRSLDLFIV